MKKLLHRIALFLLFAINLLVSCSKTPNSNIYGQWTALHIIKDNEEILKNDFFINSEHVPQADGVKLVVDPDSKSVSIFTNPKTVALFELVSKDHIQYLIISNASQEWLNGKYLVTIEIRDEIVDNVRAKLYYAKLESGQCIIYLKKGLF